MAADLPNASSLDGFVRRLRLHSQLSEDDAEAVRSLNFELAKRHQYTQLVREGDRTGRCAVLLKGYVQRFRVTDQGNRQILAVYVPGDPIDFDHLFLPVADDGLQAVRDSLLAYIRHDELHRLMAERPPVSEAIVRSLLVDASIYREWTLNVGRRDARARIAHLLCEISARLHAQGFDFKSTPLPLTQDQIADATGLIAIHVNRTLRSLASEKCIVRRGAAVMLPDPVALREVAGFDDRYLHLRRFASES